MRIFLDTANVEQIRQGAKWGVVSAVTTIPRSWLWKAKKL
jgi:transaldolase